MTSTDNKHGSGVFEDLNFPQGAQLVEMDQRQRIFEEVIISRVKVVQDFVKQKYCKLSKQMKDVKANQLVNGGSLREDQLHMDDLNNSHSG